jgi:hypothetical protein
VRAPRRLALLGDRALYAVLDEPGPYQIILAVDMVGRRGDAPEAYRYDRKVTGERDYTLVSEPLALDDLAPRPGARARTSFRAELVRGKSGHGGSTMLPEVLVTVKRVVVARRRAPVPGKDPAGYVLFGDAQALYAAALDLAEDAPGSVTSIRITGGVASTAQGAAIMQRGLLSTLTPDATVIIGKQKLPVTLEKLGEVYRAD